MKPVTFGLIADLHHGLCPTAMDRIEVFMAEVERRSPAFILQLGDFCYGDAGSRECLGLWNQFSGSRYHVLGNHDMDRMSKRAVMDAWAMPKNYYSFDRGGFHIVVLDCNYLKLESGLVDYDRGNYFKHPSARAHVDPEQLAWLKADLDRTQLPTIVFSHQGLSPSGGAANRDAVRRVMTTALRANGTRKVVACLCGHHHVDRLTPDDGLPQVWVNSASYHWVGEQYGRMADYRDSLFAFVTLDPSGTIRLTGRTSEFVAPSPRDRGYPDWEKVQPRISDQVIRFQPG
jgi:3',5'-cyclic AMP phosphodiesterase CpdA